jgi:MtN3 and saliva related transmembrane protein
LAWFFDDRGMHIEQIVGLTAGILTAGSLLPQLIKMIKEKKVEAVSFLMLFILFAGLGLWIVYGILRKDWPIVFTNAFSLLINSTMLVLRFKYSKR